MHGRPLDGCHFPGIVFVFITELGGNQHYLVVGGADTTLGGGLTARRAFVAGEINLDPLRLFARGRLGRCQRLRCQGRGGVAADRRGGE